jgi:undecaprenyl-diphosphatase
MAVAFRRIIDWLGAHGSVVIGAVLLVVAGTWGFIALADEVTEGGTQHFDDWAIRALRKPGDLATPIGPKWVEEVARDITALGGVAVLSIVTAIVVGYFVIVGKRRAAAFVGFATFGGLVLSTLLKHSFDRPRPELVPHLSQVYTSSFPSGHSMLSATVYLTLGSLLMRLAPQKRVKLYYLLVAMTLTFLVGISRVYMGVHYPTDVLAGWAAGLVWALLCWLLARALQHRGAVEKDIE